MHTTSQTLRLAFVAVVCLLVGAVQASATTYYVAPTGLNSNPGTIGSPFQTINKGLSVLAAGDTLDIRGGTYTEHITETDFPVTGNSGAWITITGHSGETVTLRNPGNSEIIRFQDGSKHHIEFKDLIVDGSTFNAGANVPAYGISLAPDPNGSGDFTHSEYLKFTNVEVKGAWWNGILGGGNYHQFINMHVHGNGRDAAYSQGNNGVYFEGSFALFQGGEYYDNQCFGLRIVTGYTAYRAEYNIIDGVKFYDNGPGHGLSGAGSGAGGCPSEGGGVILGNNNNTIRNSLLYTNAKGVVLLGLNGVAVADTDIFNNTFYANTSYAVVVGWPYAATTGTLIYNNIMRLNGGTVQRTNDTGTDERNTITTDPNFTNAGANDFTLQLGPAVDAGLTIGGFTTDFAGNPRLSGGGWDAGAYEKQLAGGTVTITTPVLPGGQRTAVYGQAITATGGTAPYTCAVTSGALPTGLSLASCVVSGTPTTVGAYGFSITATDSLSVASAAQAYVVSIVDIDAACSPTNTGSWTVRACPGASSSNGTANAVTPTMTTQAGDVVVCAIAEDKSQPTCTMQDTRSNTWTQFGFIPTSQYGRLTLYWAAMTSFGTLHTFTANAGGHASFPALQCVVVNGAAASPLDVISGGGSTLASQSLQPGVVHQTKTQEFIVAAIELEDADTTTVDGGFTSAQRSYSVGKAFGINLAWMVLANPADVNPTFSWTATMDAASSSAALFAVDSVLQSPTMPHRLRIRVH